MKYLKIKNDGVLDIRIIALMGGTTKASDSYKIGNFGTGLKYSIAHLLRNKVDFAIFCGDKKVDIKVETEIIGDSEFGIVCVDGHRTSITTKFGADWLPWQIVREIYSNALDEGGAHYSIVDEVGESVEGKEGTTSVFIELTPEFLEVYNDWNKYFIVSQQTYYEDKEVKLYPQSGNLRIYKQGIFIKELEKESLFNYDIASASINELREYTGYLEHDLYMAIVKLEDPKVITYIMEHLKNDHYEASIDWDYSYFDKFSDIWKETLSGAKIIHEKAKDNLLARGIEVDETLIVVPENLYKGLVKQFEGVGVLMTSKTINDWYEIYNERLCDRVDKARRILEDAGYFMEPELTFTFGVFGDPGTLAKIDIAAKKIYVSEKHLEQDLFSICTMLVEENEHYKTGMSDHTREFQQHFIDMYTNRLLEGANINVI
jgi:hypothetical protein